MSKLQFKSFFVYTKEQRRGVLGGMLLLVLVLSWWSINTKNVHSLQDQSFHYRNDFKWVKPFNPNFISDEKGYKLGMSINEIDNLFKFRSQNKFVHSAKEFQQVTGVSDQWIRQIAPYFKFPVFNKKNYSRSYSKTVIVKEDINTASVSDLIKVYGIGEKRANLIINYRSKLGGFVAQNQLLEVWSMNDKVVSELWKYFEIGSKPIITTLNVNTATTYQLSQVPYLNYTLAKEILFYKREVAQIQKIEELKQIPDFPVQKFDIISLYLRAE